jgi:transcriptional regulator with XRE-family HTH domain
MLITMNKKQQTVGERLRTLRERYKGRGVTAKILSEAAGITPMQLNNLENDKVKTPSHDTLIKIASFLGSTVQWIETGKGEMLPEGEIEIKKPEGSTGDPYRDYAIQRLEREVEKEEQQAKTWQEKYDQLWEMFSRVTANSFHRPVRRTA